jgi:hypothetical protein
MEALLDTIQKVRERIQKHERALRANEMLTRYALVDPILRALGWDTEDPDVVEPEFRTETGRPDYALKHEGQPLVMVEVKSLGGNIERAREEGFRYCWRKKVPFYVITDGRVWELHDLREMGGREVFRIQLTDKDFGDAARKLMALWRPAMPTVEPMPPWIVRPPEGSLSVSLESLWRQLKPGQRPPQSVRFPDGAVQQVDSWRGLLVAVARWAFPRLQELGRLPLGALIGKDPSRLRGSVELGGSWHIATNFSAQACVRNAIRITRAIGVDPNRIHVKFVPEA